MMGIQPSSRGPVPKEVFGPESTSNAGSGVHGIDDLLALAVLFMLSHFSFLSQSPSSPVIGFLILPIDAASLVH